MRKIFVRAMAFAATFGVGCDASAMMLSNRGMGQVLEFPYYTIYGNQQTLVTIVNETSALKAVKVRFREALDGRAAASFNIYLSPFDVWTGVLFIDNSVVALGTQDHSCTVPAFDPTVSHTQMPALAFVTDAFDGANGDGGPTDSSRLREGHFEVFEMGEVTGSANGFQFDADHVNGTPPGCDKLVAAWSPGGVWANDPTADMGPPTGGLFGSSAIVNVANGTYFAIAPSVIDGFSTVSQHSAPSSAAPDFDTASAGADGKVAASVEVNGQIVTAHFSRPADAVSALFMTSQSLNEYVSNVASGEQTDWVSTFPTKRFYVDPALSSTASDTLPFESTFGDTGPSSCVAVNFVAYDREENGMTPPCGFSQCPPGFTPYTFCHETSVIPLSSSGSALHSFLDEGLNATNYLGEGYLKFDMTLAGHALRSDDGYVFLGLPLTGFVAENFVNQSVTPGVLANYSATVPHRSILQSQ
jgi:hypothetical protein